TGANQTLTVPSTQDLVPGITIASNLLVNNGAGGISFGGDNGAGPVAAVPFGRIINNTIYGGATPTGVGIQVSNRGGPTIMDNILANLATGVQVDASSAAPLTTIGNNLYNGNTVDRVGIAETFGNNLSSAVTAGK